MVGSSFGLTFLKGKRRNYFLLSLYKWQIIVVIEEDIVQKLELCAEGNAVEN
jgi:hypothetical protein